MKRFLVACGVGLAVCGAATAQQAPAAGTDFQAAVWAASCMACHGTDGRAEGTGLNIAGRSEQELFGFLQAFRDGRRSATIMHQHAKGYSDDELRRIARYFAGGRP